MAGNSNSGGYKQPSEPAPVSGPGALSARTDGGATEGLTQPARNYTGGAYGDNKSTYDQGNSAPLAGDPMAAVRLPVVPLSAPSTSGLPESHGANWGDGPSLDLSNTPAAIAPNPANVIYRAMQNDPSGTLEAIYNRINQG